MTNISCFIISRTHGVVQKRKSIYEKFSLFISENTLLRAPRSICAAARANRFLPPQKGSHPAWGDKKAPARCAFGTPERNLYELLCE